MKLSVLSGRELVKALSKAGFELDHTAGSHAILRQNSARFKRVTVPLHDEIARGDAELHTQASGPGQGKTIRASLKYGLQKCLT